ncbi:MAG: hypothetical protein ACE5SW_08885, partial [Nitrososphaeraceae archaeon]
IIIYYVDFTSLMKNINYSYMWIVGALVLGLGVLGTVQTGFAQQNQSQSSGGGEVTGELAMMALDLDQIETHVTGAQEAIANADSVATLDHLSQIENLMSTLEKQPQIMQDIKSVKDAISNNDMQKATEDITKIQGQISQVKTQNPELVGNGEGGEDQEDEEDN